MQPKEMLIYLGGSSLSKNDGLGPASTVLQIKDYLLAIDYGLEFLENDGYGFPNHNILNGRKISDVIATHTHLDHVGGLALGEDYNAFEKKARVFGSPQTNAIIPIHLDQTFSRVGQSYNSVIKIEERLTKLPLGEFEIIPGVKVFIGPAGHINGACYIIVRTESGLKICFLGDHAWHDQDTVGPSSFPDDIPDEWLPDILAQIDLTNPKETEFDYEFEMGRIAQHAKESI